MGSSYMSVNVWDINSRSFTVVMEGYRGVTIALRSIKCYLHVHRCRCISDWYSSPPIKRRDPFQIFFQTNSIGTLASWPLQPSTYPTSWPTGPGNARSTHTTTRPEPTVRHGLTALVYSLMKNHRSGLIDARHVRYEPT